MTESPELRPMPFSMGAEKAVLSVLMQFPAFWHDRGDLVPEWFHLPQNRLLCASIAEVMESGLELELVSFYQRLLDAGKLDAIGGVGYVTEVYGYQPSNGHFRQHLEILRHKLACRMVIHLAGKMEETAYDAPDVAELLDVTSAPITAIHDTITGSKPAPDTKQIVREWFERYQRMIEGEEKPMGWQTGIEEIDQAFQGLHPGQYGVISAPSSGGKSTLASQIMCGLASRSVPCSYILIEGDSGRLCSRCMIQLTGLDSRAITNPRLHAEMNGRNAPTKEEEKRIAMAAKTMLNGCFHFDSPANRRIDTVASSIRRAHRKHGIKVAFVDYVQLIRGEKGTSKEQEMMGISNTIQELAKELQIFIVVMSQQNADGDTKHARAIEEDSDWTLAIIQEMDKKSESYKEHKFILITKERHNSLPGEKLPLILDRQRVRFVTGEQKAPEKKPRPRAADF